MLPLAHVDLTAGRVETREVPAEWRSAFLGGASLAARLFYSRFTESLDPLSPEAPLLFINGPLTGTAGPAVGRFVVAARSPATRLWGESNCGGFWGPELRRAGFDGLWVTGRAEQPVWLSVEDGRVEIHPGEHLWGLETYQTQEALQAQIGGRPARVAAIGPAGEAALPYALILCDHGRVAGRTGMGAVMGSKNLKAIAVRGDGPLPLSDPAAFAAFRGQANRILKADSLTDVLREMGSSGGADYFDYLGVMPKKYYQTGIFEGTARVTGSSIAQTIQVGVTTCHGCVIACGRLVQLDEGPRRKGPEYETLVGFGPNLMIDDPAAITRLGELCDRLGVDTISMSNTIGLALALYERGLIRPGDAGERTLRWGDPQLVADLIRLAVHREGFGELLAEGSRELARRFGAEGEAVQVNGLEAAYHDPRGASGMALVYATSPRGACHNQSDYFMVDIGQVEEKLSISYHSRQGGPEKAADVARHQDWRTVCNALVQCMFANVPPDTTLALLNAALGLDLSLEALLQAGERGWNLKRAINNRFGLRRQHDRLPKPFLRPYPDGGSAGFVPDFEAMLEAYYQARGWDPATGMPTATKLRSLGLGWVVEDLWPAT